MERIADSLFYTHLGMITQMRIYSPLYAVVEEVMKDFRPSDPNSIDAFHTAHVVRILIADRVLSFCVIDMGNPNAKLPH